MKKKDVIIIGGGLSGLTAAIALAKFGREVLLFETNTYPHHRVCGEYVSNEVLPYLQALGVDLMASGAVAITDFELTGTSGTKATTKLPLGGLGISRYCFDEILYHRAQELRVDFIFSKVVGVHLVANEFTVSTATEKYSTKMVIGAYGKRATLDKTFNRPFSFKKQDWLAVKTHYRQPNFPDNLVGLHTFHGGYGGLSKTETGSVNFCYLAHYSSFKKHNDIATFNEKVVSKNPYLASFLSEATPIFEKPLAIAQISFHKKQPVENNIFMCGDTAGLIHPLCGNGMAMAIHSAKLATESIHHYLDTPNGLAQAQHRYTREWNALFKKRLWFGRQLQRILLQKSWVNLGLGMAQASNRTLKFVISKTHGKPIV